MQIFQSTATYTRVTGTTQYSSGDIIANHATGASVTPMSFKLPSGRGFKIWRVGLLKSSTTVTDAQFRLHLYNDSPTCANGDNSAFSTTVSGWLGSIDIDGQNTAFSDDAKAFGVFVNNSVFAPMFIYTDLDRRVYGLLEARDTYTPADSEVFTVTLYGEAYS